MTHHGILSDDDDVDLSWPVPHGPRLSAIAKAYDPNQPRDDKGRWTPSGAAGARSAGGLLDPHDQPELSPPTKRSPGRPTNPLATTMHGLSRATQTKLRAQLRDNSKPKGLDQPDIERNLSRLMDDAIANSPDLVAEGKVWYAKARDRIRAHAAASGFDHPTATAITAVLSPQNEWGQNIAGAGFLMRTIRDNPTIRLTPDERAYLGVKATGRTKAGTDIPDGVKFNDLTPHQAAWATVVLSKRAGLKGENPTKKGTIPLVAWSSGTGPIVKAVEIARGAAPADVLAGHKVRSFYNNLTDPFNHHGLGDVTIDTHAVSASIGRRVTAVDPALGKFFADAPSIKAENVKGTYPIFADAFRNVAAKYGLEPNQAQATLWLHWQRVRDSYPDIHGKPPRPSTTGRYGVQMG